MKTKTFENRTKEWNRDCEAYRIVYALMTTSKKRAMEGIPLTHWVKTSTSGHYEYYESIVKWIMYDIGMKYGIDYEVFNDTIEGWAANDKIRLTPQGCRKLIRD